MINGKRIASIVQARQGSSRLPGKALLDIGGRPALQRVIERLRAAKTLDDIIIATTTNSKDDCIAQLCEKLGCNYSRGSEEDVLSRVLEAARQFNIDVIVEITADCVLIDPSHVNALVEMYIVNNAIHDALGADVVTKPYDMVSNIIERTFPRGYDIRVFSTETLERVNREVDNPIDRSHVSPWMYLNPKGKQNYTCLNWTAPPGQNRPDIEVTLDTPEDRELLNWIFAAGEECKSDLSCQDVINLLDTFNPDCYLRVQKVARKNYFAELQQCYDNMPKGGLVESNTAVLHKDTVVPRTMMDKLSEAVNAISGGAKKENEPKKRGPKPGRKKR
jgi:spore coat polysaccharide biosynthesis protein SpsF